MSAGSFAVGGFGGSCLYFDRQAAIVEISFENQDDFIHRLVCLRCECRGVLAMVPAGPGQKDAYPAAPLSAWTTEK